MTYLSIDGRISVVAQLLEIFIIGIGEPKGSEKKTETHITFTEVMSIVKGDETGF